jgi:lipid-A-disaccharide synthase
VNEPSRLLVVAGEASGDRLAAGVLERLGVPAFGLGGPEMAAQGCRLVLDQADVAAMGIGSVLGRAVSLVRAFQKLEAAIRSERPRAALLVGFSEFNARIGPRLRSSGTRVLWYAPPQIWAWRPKRGARLGRAADILGLLFPFETKAWEPWHAAAHYVGHPAIEVRHASREEARDLVGAPRSGELVAIMPGSREQEVRSHLPLLLDAFARLSHRRPGIGAKVVVARGLSPDLAAWAARRARSRRVGALAVGLPELLPVFDLALAVSGTVTLEATLAGVPPVIVYRPGPLSAWWARRALRVPFVGLPNLVLEEAAFPELLGAEACPERIADRAQALFLARPRALDACDRVRAALRRGLGRAPSAHVAALLAPWL